MKNDKFFFKLSSKRWSDRIADPRMISSQRSFGGCRGLIESTTTGALRWRLLDSDDEYTVIKTGLAPTLKKAKSAVTKAAKACPR